MSAFNTTMDRPFIVKKESIAKLVNGDSKISIPEKIMKELTALMEETKTTYLYIKN